MTGAVLILPQQAAFQARRQQFYTQDRGGFTGRVNCWKQKGGRHDIITCTSSRTQWLRARGCVNQCISMESQSSNKPKCDCPRCRAQTCVFVQNRLTARQLLLTSGLGYSRGPLLQLQLKKGGKNKIKGNLEVAR